MGMGIGSMCCISGTFGSKLVHGRDKSLYLSVFQATDIADEIDICKRFSFSELCTVVVDLPAKHAVASVCALHTAKGFMHGVWVLLIGGAIV